MNYSAGEYLRETPLSRLKSFCKSVGRALFGTNSDATYDPYPPRQDLKAMEAEQDKLLQERNQRIHYGNIFRSAFRAEAGQIQYGGWKSYSVIVQSPPPESSATQSAIVTEEHPVIVDSPSGGRKEAIQRTIFRNQAGLGLRAERQLGTYIGGEWLPVGINRQPISYRLDLEESISALGDLGAICNQVTSWESAPDPVFA